MFYRILKKTSLIAFWLTATASSYAATAFIRENPDQIRFEQYVGISGFIVFWRLPTPGVSTFTGSTCLSLSIVSDKAEQASRFMALYLYAKSNGKQIFYYFDTDSCAIRSFGMDG